MARDVPIMPGALGYSAALAGAAALVRTEGLLEIAVYCGSRLDLFGPGLGVAPSVSGTLIAAGVRPSEHQILDNRECI